MSTPIDLDRLSDYFPAEDIVWRPMHYSSDGRRAMAAAYLTNRAIMDRLDAVCGRLNWTNTFQPGPDGGVLCGLSIHVDGAWVTKWDGAENTDIEPVKGGLSNAMKRAAAQWGIGRYLYSLPAQWLPVDAQGRFVKPPQMAPAFLPAGTGDGAGDGAVHTPQQPAVALSAPTARQPSPDAPATPPAEPEATALPPVKKQAEASLAPAPSDTTPSDTAPSDTAPPAKRMRASRSFQVAEPRAASYNRTLPPRSDADEYFLPNDLPF